MSSILKEITDNVNLYWAWEKARFCYTPGDTWFNELEVAAFEANLNSELQSIREDIIAGAYKLKPIIPVPFPKGKDDKGPRTRQTFWVSARDQVTWLAVVNIIGRHLDSHMPFWSYGNRLFIPVFKNAEETFWRFGYYRNTTKYIYRSWKQSWPLFRRHINITAKILSREEPGVENLDIDETEESLIDTNNHLSDIHPLRVFYIEPDYWKINFDGKLYWAGLDLEKFYPNVKQESIKQNIKKYLAENADEALLNLLDNLFAFSVNYENWESDELLAINMAEKQSHYQNIPTGLFVAGFLANTAMLEIDIIINNKLKANKNIAHFRYVDDHVILAKSFDELMQWIDEYNILLSEQDIGTTFNPAKTEPDSLAKYYAHLNMEKEKKDDWEEELLIKKKEAESSTLLDPEFPSPLMTQTLAKVSKIAHINFQLLTPQEEQSLIADVEHLLVTDFPDQELRRDTRVSFAARMLSFIIPQITGDVEKVYQLKRHSLEISQQIEFFQKKIQFADNVERAEFIEKIDFMEEESKRNIKDIDDLEKSNSNAEKKLVSRALKMLLKAVKENHEKVRLWTRIFEFSLHGGISNSNKILGEIKKLKERGETNDLSITFINSLILQVVSNLIFQSFRIMSGASYSSKRKKRAGIFLENILSDDFFEYFQNSINYSAKEHEKISFDIFRFTTGTIIFLITTHGFINNTGKYSFLVKKYGLVNWAESPHAFCEATNYSFSTWVWWLLGKLPKREYDEHPYLWEIIIDRLRAKEETTKIILQLYPNHLSEKALVAIEKSVLNSKLQLNEAFLFEVYQSLVKRKMHTDYVFLELIKDKSKSTEEYITLCDWIDWTFDQGLKLSIPHDGQLIFDPRLSEWAALEILSWITELMISKIENISFESLFTDPIDYSEYIHPNNFLLPREMIQTYKILTWEDLRTSFKASKDKVKFKPDSELIRDLRYVSSTSLSSFNDSKIQASISGLSALLICLLAKNYNLPPHWNPIGHQMAWLNLYKIKLKEITISSHTRNIIDGSFSKKNRETRLLKSLMSKVSYIIDDDTFKDPPSFNDMKEFNFYINFSKGILKSQQISVSNHQPRQLIPISLKQLNRTNYQDNHIIEE